MFHMSTWMIHLTKRQKCVSYGSYLRKCSMADNTTKNFDILTFYENQLSKEVLPTSNFRACFFGKVSAIQANQDDALPPVVISPTCVEKTHPEKGEKIALVKSTGFRTSKKNTSKLLNHLHQVCVLPYGYVVVWWLEQQTFPKWFCIKNGGEK